MPERKSRTALWSSAAAALSAIATLIAQRAISPANAQEHSSAPWATAAQVEELAVEVRAVLQRLRDVELEQARAQGARTAAHREHAR